MKTSTATLGRKSVAAVYKTALYIIDQSCAYPKEVTFCDSTKYSHKDVYSWLL